MDQKNRRILLSQSQEKELTSYKEKWAEIYLSTEKYALQKIIKAIDLLYQINGFSAPKVIYCQTPLEALSISQSLRDAQSVHLVQPFLRLKDSLPRFRRAKGMQHTKNLLLHRNVSSQLNEGLRLQLGEQVSDLTGYVHIKGWRAYMGWMDFCLSALGIFTKEEYTWELLKNLFRYCEHLFTFNGVCVVCSHHTYRQTDSNLCLHACSKPAISYSGELNIYFYHGDWLPPDYGKLPPSEWQASWLLQEPRETVRHTLMQGIGITRVLESLNVEEVGSWQEYTLLEVKPLQIAPIPIQLKILKWFSSEVGKNLIIEVPLYLDSAFYAAMWAESCSITLKRMRTRASWNCSHLWR